MLTGTKRCVIAATAMALCAGGGAHGQDSNDGDDDVERIAITGSRTITDGFAAPSPVTVLGASQYEYRGGADIADILNELPAFNSAVTPDSTGINLINGGANVIDLRGLGANRALTLVNGRRFVFGASRDLAVDFNVLPTALIERVEVVTGGASAVYGSDAVSGVVNVIYDEDFEGLRATLQGGISQEGDSEQGLFSLAAGTRFAQGRGHVSVGLDYEDRSGFRQGDRDFSSRGTALIPNAADMGPNDGVPAQIVAQDVGIFVVTEQGVPLTTTGGFFIDPATGLPQQFTPQGGLAPFNPGMIVGTGAEGLAIGGDGVTQNFEETLQQTVPLERLAVTGTASYALTNTLTAFAEATYADTEAEQRQSFYFFTPSDAVIVPVNSPAVPPGVAQGVFDAGEQAFILSRAFTDLPPIDQTLERQTYRIAGGLEGTFQETWRWSAYGQFGRTDSEAVYPNQLITSNFLAAVGAVSPITGQPLFECVAPCAPLNVFGSGQASPEAVDFVFDPTVVEDAQLEQIVAAAEVAGEAFALPAGPLAVAAGFEYRDESIESAVDERVTAGDTFLNPFFPIDGSFDLWEIFGEANIPLIADKPFADELSVNVAARYTDYSTVGGVTTWKVGSSWAPIPDLRLRGSVSRDIRAPNLRELFQAGGGGVLFVDDPCQNPLEGSVEETNCAAAGIPPNVPSGLGFNFSNITGNPDLDEESADTFTIGLVYRPQWLEGFSLSLDWFQIDIEDAIVAVAPQEIINQCFGAATFPNAFCGQIERNPLSGEIQTVTSEFENLDTFETSGLDVEIVYDTPLSRLGAPLGYANAPGDLRLRWVATFLDEFTQTPGAAGAVPIDLAGEVGNADVQWNLNGIYSVGPFTGFTQVRYIGESTIDNALTREQSALLEVDPEVYWDLSGSVRLEPAGRQVDLTVGVDNVLNNEPPFAPTPGNIFFTEASVYDVRGRFFFVRASLEL